MVTSQLERRRGQGGVLSGSEGSSLIPLERKLNSSMGTVGTVLVRGEGNRETLRDLI
jgi:hypothetical protein